jgi:hypothetical protein
MYTAKRRGRGTSVFYDGSLEAEEGQQDAVPEAAAG